MTIWRSPHPDLSYPHHLTTWQWLFEPVGAKWSPIYNRPKSQALGYYINASTGETLDFGQVKQKATQLSTVLVQKYGLKPGDTVSLFSTNTLWYPVAQWAVLRAGGRVNGASPAYSKEEMTHALKTANTTILLTLPSALPVAIAAATSVGIPPERIFLLEGETEGFLNIQALMEEAQQYRTPEPWSIPGGKTNKDICGYLNFSSGTTGLPKAVMISHHNVIAQCLQLQQLQVIESGENYRILAVMPLFHITGLVRFCTYPLLMNGVCVMLPSFTLPSMLQAIVDFKIRELILVPPILIRLVRDPVVEKYDLRHVMRWSSGSAPISPEIIKALEEKFPWTGFRQGYGATESTACISCHPPTHYAYKYASTGGLPVANTLVKVISIDDGRELGPGETGEVCAKGPQIVMGYLNNEAATRETFVDGWLRTGDVGHVDDEGLIHIEDRIKEMIKVRGLQVPPAELEDLLLGHPDVEDAAVTSVPDDYSGEKPKAFVVLKKGVPATQDSGRKLLDYVKERKVRYKWLKEIEFATEIPKSGTGKLLRRVLKAMERENRNKGLRVLDVERGKL